MTRTANAAARACRARGSWGLACLLVAGLPVTAFAQASADPDISFGLRYRLEQVQQDGFGLDAIGTNGRARVTLDTGQRGAFSFAAQVDYSFILGADDFNSLANGKTNLPIIADPDGLDLNQAYVRYQMGEGDSSTAITAGRQRINHGSQRLLGGVAWRNNEQTFDAVRVQRTGRVGLDYSYAFNVNRIFGPDNGVQPAVWKTNSHFLRATFSPMGEHELAGFAYLIDLEHDNARYSGGAAANSNMTWGFDYKGALPGVKLSATVAFQSDYGDNPNSYNAVFYGGEAAFDLAMLNVTLGHHTLGSDDGRHAFRAPLATLHKWQGWTDKFLGTPPKGVRDTWVATTKKMLGFTLTGVYHDFRAVDGGDRYGSELGASLVYSPMERVTLQAKAARYFADGWASDTTKLWLVFSWNM